VFTQHETVLQSHLELLDSVKCHVATDCEAFRTVSAMVTKTIQSINQSKMMRKHMNGQKKDVSIVDSREPSSDARAPKRKRDITSQPGVGPENTSNTPTSGSHETEDISEEVQRRLRIKEELRRKKNSKKRKRESLLSTESTSPAGQRPKKKRPDIP
ncbi:hypothetical protein N7462_005011, partial [Penicillium macrosclerotiorum]|uniref:uncharacterized protein n=1 Tax=Penicillium macrosclerotiorum TaxID=303699 RepID=UPI002547DDD6